MANTSDNSSSYLSKKKHKEKPAAKGVLGHSEEALYSRGNMSNRQNIPSSRMMMNRRKGER